MTREEKLERNRIRSKIWRENNRQKSRDAQKRYRANNKDKVADYKLKSRYGISLEQYNIMLATQDKKCAICGKAEDTVHNTSGKLVKLSVDHNHKTGAVRALLCQDCNIAIGYFGEDAERMMNGAKYIQQWNN